ncbi:type IV secretory system conjugative DNA transfer family protein [Rhodoblastus sp.]|uniref:type IV secretory system conjugative DNA transfer family protein n=1 Tax=Rhodoblastus sp. TaxID=1962975 RepID=UPI003F9BE852
MANGEPVTVGDNDWRQHAYAIGGTGSGKTTWLESLMAADLSERRGFCYIDKHGDSAKRIADSSPQPMIYWRPATLSHVIGLNPLHNVPPDERWKVTANVVSVFSDIWGLGEQTPRLIYFLRASVRLLLDTHGTTLLDIRRVLSDATYRRHLLKKCKDEETRQTWREFDAKDARQQTQEIGSLQNKVAALADALPLRLVLGQHTSTIDIRRIIDRGTVMVCDFSGLGEEPSRLLGALLVSSFAQAAEARSEIAEAERRDYTIYIDEFQNFASLAFTKILSEARKWRLSIVLCHQFIGQISERGLHEAVLGNCGTLISFRVGAEDAPRLARALDAPESELASLSRGHAYVRTLRDGHLIFSMPMEIEMATLGTGRLAAAIANTHANFSRPRHLAERRPTPQRRDWH